MLCQHALVKHGLVLFFHAHRAAAAAHIAGDLVDIGHMDHRHALFAHTAGGGLQIQLRCHRNDEDEIVFAGSLRYQRFVHACRVLAHAGCHGHAVHSHALFVGVLVGGVGYLFTFQNAHGIGFCFFSHI